MRVFFALPIPENIQNECMKIIHEQQNYRHLEEMRWTHIEHLHITIRFLAEITTEQLTQFETILPELLSQCAPITLETRKLFLFPPRNPHLFAMGIHLNKELANLYRVINIATVTAGFPEERRPFTPHITLGRFKHPSVSEHLRIHPRPPIVGNIEEIILYQSEPTETGSIYTKLQSFRVGKVIFHI